MQLLARDGIAAAQEGPRAAIMVERVLMMPSSRIEVAIDRNASERPVRRKQPLEAVLKTYGHYTGGDAWPAVDLAAVTFEAAPPATGSERDAHARDPLPADGGGTLDASADLNQSAGRAQERRRSADCPRAGRQPAHHLHGQAPPNEHPMPLPTQRECKPLEPGEEQVIALAIDNSGNVFKIGASRAKRESLTPAEWKTVVQKTVEAARPFGDANSPLLCAHAGTTEVWNIVNQSSVGNQESHNFHIHQTKFEVLAVDDPHGRIEPPRGGAAAKRLVDNYPVPIDGSIRIRIRFNETQAGGRFVFHCHILEHEDKGMMAAIEVLPH